MMTSEILEAARVLAENLESDIMKARDREMHILITMRAARARDLYTELRDAYEGEEP